MGNVEKLKDLLTDILDIETKKITLDTYLIRDLGAESIDLLEISVGIIDKFKIDVNDNELFLKNLRFYIIEAQENAVETDIYINEKLPFLSIERIKEMLNEVDNGPVLKICDIISYISYQEKK